MATPALSSSVTEFPFFSNGSANASTSHESGDYDDDDGDGGENWLSPRRLLSLLTTVLVPLVFGVIVVVGIIGNLLVIAVVVTNQQMRNTTNVLILSLALADLLFIVLCVPFTGVDYALSTTQGWPFGLLWCKTVQYLIYTTNFFSIYTLILMSMDRFLAVVYPIVSLPYRTVRNAALATTVTWTVIASASLPIWFTHHLVHDPGNEKQWCQFDQKKYNLPIWQLAFFISGYAIPLSVIVILYVFMLRRLWNPAVGRQVSKDALRNKRRVTKLVLVVIVVFAVCWAPIHFVFVFKAVGIYTTKVPEDFKLIVFQILSHVLAYVNSCVNPILYAFLSDNFRKAFHHLLPRFCHRRIRGGGAGGDAEDSHQPKSATGMLSYQITTKRRRQNSLDADVPNSGSTRGGGGLVCETKRFGKRGKLVKHETALTLVSPGGGQGGQGVEAAESATTVQKDGVLCTKL